ncbi:hypothetical protein OHB12_02475 [Nocardia sp. NBC_01730]|uniref:hypothetical protein n=1 Tax=Nocardia sp. NBC_01730 TaxID=2975998 RepID=UPI002E12F0AB|nr:hypothetical protein OHB12_02475 [Nocardia sp. NBC_01730]
MPPQEEGGEERAGESVTEAASWSMLNEFVGAGDLLVDNDIALTCANLCADFIEVLRGIRDQGDVEGASSYVAYAKDAGYGGAPLPSLETLDIYLTNLGTKLYDIIGSEDREGTRLHDLNNLKELFISAGKAYEIAEGISASDFDSITSGGVTPLIDRTPGSWVPTSSRIDELLPEGESFESVSDEIGPDPSKLSYKQLYDLGEFIRGVDLPYHYESRAILWYRMGDTLRDKSTEFKNDLVLAASDSWTGKGKEYAITTVDNFKNQLDPLWRAMHQAGHVYTHAGYWLDETQKEMPQDAENPNSYVVNEDGWWIFGTAKRVEDDPTPQYQEAYRNTYKAGYEETTKYFPKFPEYAGTPNDGQSTDDEYTQAGGGGAGLNNGLGGSPLDKQWAALDSYADELEQQAADLDGYANALDPIGADPAAGLSNGMGALTDALSTASNAVQNALGAAKNALPSDLMKPPAADLPSTSAGLDAARNLVGGKVGGGGVGGAPHSAPKAPYDASRLFPRVNAGTTMAGSAAQVPRAGAAPMAGQPMTGTPGPAGTPAAGARGGGQESKRERPKYLDSAEHLDDALGEAPDMTRAVVGGIQARHVTEQAQQPAPPEQQPNRPRMSRSDPPRAPRPEEPIIVRQPEAP